MAEQEIIELERQLSAAKERLAEAKRRYDLEEMTHGQLDRNRALRTMQTAFGYKESPMLSEEGHLTLTRRGALWMAAASGCGYYVLRLLLRDHLGRYKWYKVLQAKSDRTRLFELYLLSIVNAVFISSYSVYKLATGSASTQGCTRMLATALGYFVHDFFAMRHEFKNDIGMFVHHVFGIALTGTAISAPPSIKKYVPIFGTVELSTIFLSIMWLMRETGNTKGRGFKLNMALFAISFFATRILAMPAYLRKVWHEEGFRALGHVRYAFVGLCGLNLFWFVKILKMAKAQTAVGVAATAIAGGTATAVSL